MKHEDHKKTGSSSGFPAGVKGSSMGSTRTTKPNSGVSRTAKGRNKLGEGINDMNSGGNLGSRKY